MTGVNMASSSAVTILDVARAVGVTDATVSNVLNGKGRVSEVMRQRVLVMARDMGYQSNALARGLRTGRTYTLGILATNLDSPLTAGQLSGIDSAARERGYTLLITTSDRAERPDPKSLSARGVDGLIAVAASADTQPWLYEALKACGLPYVYSYRSAPDDPQPSGCTIDQQLGGALAAQRLLAIGRSRLAYVGAPRSMLISVERLQGFQESLTASGVTLEEKNILFGGGHWITTGVELVEVLLNQRPLPDGIFAATDFIAFGVLRVCRQRGIRIPEDIALIGFDNSPLCSASEPALTSVKIPLVESGKLAVSNLIDFLEDGSESASISPLVALPPELVVRESA
jgi:DNA-binding LacI/PurR family transcriptional regulator